MTTEKYEHYKAAFRCTPSQIIEEKKFKDLLVNKGYDVKVFKNVPKYWTLASYKDCILIGWIFDSLCKKCSFVYLVKEY